jgi:hypothetical protein
MASQALRITRQQFASFLPDEETIRKFEKLVLLVEQINTTSIDELQTETGIALQKANEAIDRFYNIFAGSIKLDVSGFNDILSSADTNLQLAMDTLDDHNHDGRYYTETESDTLFDKKIKIITSTSTTESIDATSCDIIRQTSSGITTTLTGLASGVEVTIKNDSGGTNTISNTIEGEANQSLYDGESFHLVYNGTDLDIL